MELVVYIWIWVMVHIVPKATAETNMTVKFLHSEVKSNYYLILPNQDRQNKKEINLIKKRKVLDSV